MTMRSVQDRFWSDGWVRSINPLDRYLALYLLTNEHTNWCGLYELEIGVMAFESGLDREELQRSMLPKLSPKFVYVDGWVYIPNWTRHHMSESGTLSPTQQKGIEAAWKTVPERIRLKIKEVTEEPYSDIPPAYPIGGVSPSSFAFSSASSGEPSSQDIAKLFQPRNETPDEAQPKPKSQPKYPHSKEVFACFKDQQKSWQMNATQLKHGELLFERGLKNVRDILAFCAKHADEEFMPVFDNPISLERNWTKIQKFADRNGL